ncbi:M20/M25/M40 family metallo-hydrolase [Bacteroidota bacterium]
MKKLFTIKSVILLSIIFFNFNLFAEKENELKDEFPVQELKNHVYFLASDYLKGRVVGTEGYNIAADYVKSQFMACGLKPIIIDSTENFSFYQNIDMKRKDYFLGGSMEVYSNKEKRVFENLKDFKIFRSMKGKVSNEEMEVVYIGYGIEDEEAGWNDFEGLDIKNKIAILNLGTPHENGEPLLGKEKDDFYSSPQGRNTVFSNVLGKHPAMLLLIVNDRLRPWYNNIPGNAREMSVEYNGEDFFGNATEVFTRICLVETYLADFLISASNITIGELDTNASKYKTFEVPKTTVEMNIDIEYSDISSANVVGLLEGCDSILKNEYVVIGGHLDHVEDMSGRVMNGADDNASGITTIIEIAGFLAKNPSKRSVIFIAFTAEEQGLYGSKKFIEDCPVDTNSIVTFINFDCVGRKGFQAKDDFEILFLDAETSCEESIALIEKINEEVDGMSLAYEMPQRWGTSDHANFMSKGIPVIDFFNGANADTHQPTDDADRIDYEYLQKVCILGGALVERLANMDGRLCGDR